MLGGLEEFFQLLRHKDPIERRVKYNTIEPRIVTRLLYFFFSAFSAYLCELCVEFICKQ